MIKPISYAGTYLRSWDIESVPHADMEDLLEAIIEGSWSDYKQILNGYCGVAQDLNLKCIDGTWLIPVENVGNWLFSFSIQDLRSKNRFRVFRRDVEKVFRVAWALPVSDLCFTYYEPEYVICRNSLWDISNIFLNYGLQEDDVSSILNLTPIEYIGYVASNTYCGSRGYILSELIDYLEDLPEEFFLHINEALLTNMVEPRGYLDDYLDDLNTYISLEASRFVGEL